MKKFFSFLIFITVLCCYIFYTNYHYTGDVIVAHIIIVSIIFISIFAFNVCVIRLLSLRLAIRILHCFNFLALLSILLIYILIITSNSLWGKTITLKILSNYITNFDKAISVLPITPWLLYSTIILFALLVLVIYLFIRPKIFRKNSTYNIKLNTRHSILVILILTIAIIVFVPALVKLKRKAQFIGEPILQMFFGPLWGAADNKSIAFDTEKIKNGLKDKSCIEKVAQEKILNDSSVIIIILLDAMRADHLPMYGYTRPVAPFLDSLFKNNELMHVRHAYSTSNGTVGGMAGLFYSKDYDDFGYNGLSLMKYMQMKGYKTSALLTGFHRDWYDLSALYKNNCDYYYESAIDPLKNEDDDLITLDKIKTYKFSKKSLTYIHLLSTHTIGKKNDTFKKFLPDKIDLVSDKSQALINNYDNGVNQADFVIKEIFNQIKESHLLENSIVYIVADHGEMFGEDNLWSHGKNVHPKLLEIPILIYDKNKPFYRNLDIATIKDIAPTILQRIGYAVPDCWQGKSLSNEPNDFSLKINSVSNTEYPLGVLTKKDTTLQLDVFNNAKTIKITYKKNISSDWKKQN